MRSRGRDVSRLAAVYARYACTTRHSVAVSVRWDGGVQRKWFGETRLRPRGDPGELFPEGKQACFAVECPSDSVPPAAARKPAERPRKLGTTGDRRQSSGGCLVTGFAAPREGGRSAKRGQCRGCRRRTHAFGKHHDSGRSATFGHLGRLRTSVHAAAGAQTDAHVVPTHTGRFDAASLCPPSSPGGVDIASGVGGAGSTSRSRKSVLRRIRRCPYSKASMGPPFELCRHLLRSPVGGGTESDAERFDATLPVELTHGAGPPSVCANWRVQAGAALRHPSEC